MHDGLLPDMAEQFNKEGHTTSSGDKIKVEVVQVDSATQVEDLANRVAGEGRLNPDLNDPTIITPQAEHWLVSLNDAAGKEVVDAKSSPSIAKTVLGIMTYREMAECLGWPQEQIGYADIIALREDPRGWASHRCAQTEWGQVPKLVFTNPRT